MLIYLDIKIPHLQIAHQGGNFEVGNIKIHLNDKVKIVRKLTQLRAHLSLYFCAAYNVIIDAVREGHCALIMICTEKSFAKALVSLWLAHISHRLHRAQWPSVDPAFDCRLSPHLLHTCQTEGLKRLNQKLTSKLRFERYDIFSLLL